jgi:fructose-1,6-bisphosphatase/inositol monophosphatase family enzyme
MKCEREQFEMMPNFEQIIFLALRRAYEVHENLGSRGEELIQKNQFGETALRIDIEAEEAVINVLKENNIPIRIISEEHGQIDIMPNPKYLGVLDGLDGSNRYQAGRGTERYGTMFGVFSNIDPLYHDYITSGIMEHSTGNFFSSQKNASSFLLEKNGDKSLIHVSDKNILNKDTKIYINEYWELCRNVFLSKLKGREAVDPRAYSTYFSDLASGKTDLVLTCTGKNNLEIAIGFGLIAEAGGVIIDSNGESLENKKYLQFGQKEQLPIIAASSQELAQDLIDFLKSKNKD